MAPLSLPRAIARSSPLRTSLDSLQYHASRPLALRPAQSCAQSPSASRLQPHHARLVASTARCERENGQTPVQPADRLSREGPKERASGDSAGAGASSPLPLPKQRLGVRERVVVPSTTEVDKRYIIERAWRLAHQKAPVPSRTCKHLRKLLGDDHEDARCGRGTGVAKKSPRSKAAAVSPGQAIPFGSRGIASSSNSSTIAGRRKALSHFDGGSVTQSIAVSAGEKGERNFKAEKNAGTREGIATGNGSKGSGAEADVVQEQSTKTPKGRKGGIELLLAHSFDLDSKKKDPTGWWMSEKLDGVRAYWDGESTLWSRLGNPFYAPDSFTSLLPRGHDLDGELFIGRNRFDETSGIVRSMCSGRWGELRFMAFDIPSQGSKPFEERLAALHKLLPRAEPRTISATSAAAMNPREEGGVARVVKHERCEGWEHLLGRLEEVKLKRGEGLMLREPGSKYVNKRSKTLLKVKTFHDAEARVVGYEPGKGKYTGMVGALECVMQDEKTTFSVGSGLTDDRRVNPPPIGAIVTYRFQDLTKAGLPRFPTFVGERHDVDAPKDAVLSGRVEQ